MKEDKTINDGKVLYISGYGEDSNETVVYALNMPVSVTVYIDNNGSGIVEFKGEVFSQRRTEHHWLYFMGRSR